MSCTTTQTSISRRSTELAARRRLRHAQSVNPGQQSQLRFADRLASPRAGDSHDIHGRPSRH
jgi:hypothetical protein